MKFSGNHAQLGPKTSSSRTTKAFAYHADPRRASRSIEHTAAAGKRNGGTWKRPELPPSSTKVPVVERPQREQAAISAAADGSDTSLSDEKCKPSVPIGSEEPLSYFGSQVKLSARGPWCGEQAGPVLGLGNTLNRVDFSFFITSGLRLRTTGHGIYFGPPDVTPSQRRLQDRITPDARIAWPNVRQPSFLPTARGSGKQGKARQGHTPTTRQPQAKINIGLRVSIQATQDQRLDPTPAQRVEVSPLLPQVPAVRQTVQDLTASASSEIARRAIQPTDGYTSSGTVCKRNTAICKFRGATSPLVLETFESGTVDMTSTRPSPQSFPDPGTRTSCGEALLNETGKTLRSHNHGLGSARHSSAPLSSPSAPLSLVSSALLQQSSALPSSAPLRSAQFEVGEACVASSLV
ncbi:hypothetical protein ON010_g6533 [Phytophthora cinnamomi]|nr:hypothetical protein ON010_g6533 [Phytophthora cinnamomi]